MLDTSLTKIRRWPLALLALSLTGCGLTQSVSDGTKSAFSSVFYKKIKVLHLDFVAREELNTDTRESNAFSAPVLVRIYQLKEAKTFENALYQQLLKEGDTLLQDDLLASRDVIIKPGGSASLDMPMETNTRFVGVVGLFRQPDQEKNTWKLILDREALDPDKPRVIEVGSNQLTPIPEKE
ncbi:type VI secretion protein [Cedecea neteri]|uniref:Type VI secretion protein n=1 Tax=Cedecea neteri TaxID=158822 RepID=A0AAN0VUH1_9ENTR|nr:type VI secretion system lipoprotein TssJ [Cedecea neteri]AIR62109.1 type VI secretion protein [Cedecea neteri]